MTILLYVGGGLLALLIGSALLVTLGALIYLVIGRVGESFFKWLLGLFD